MQRRSFLGAISCLPARALSSPAVPQHSAKGTPTSRSRRVGIALGGGSIHGIAHLGVLRAFAEKGLKFQFIAGTSAGAMVDVLAAAQLPLGQIELIARRIEWPGERDRSIALSYCYPSGVDAPSAPRLYIEQGGLGYPARLA